MPKFTLKHIKDYLQNKLYPYTHSDAVYTDDEENKTLTDTLSEINRKINDSAVHSQADWNETDNTINSYIRNKPVSLPANGGNADTVGNISPKNFSMKSDLDSHKNDILAHQELFNAKLSMDTASLLLKEPSFDQSTGVLTFTRLNGTTLSFSIPKSLVFKSALFDDTVKQIIITWSDDSKTRIPVDGLIDVYTGSENDVIQITVNDENIISAVIKNGSVTRTLLSTDVQTDLSKAHIHSNESTINKFSEDSNGNVLFNGTSISTESGTTDYTDLTNKPQINNVELSGNKSLSDLGIETIGSADAALSNAKAYTYSVASSKVGIEHLTNHVKPDNVTIISDSDGNLQQGFKTYTSLSQIGLANGTTTLEIAKALPDKSMIILTVFTDIEPVIDLPETDEPYGLLVITRLSTERTIATYNQTALSGVYYRSTYHKYIRVQNNLGSSWIQELNENNYLSFPYYIKAIEIPANADLNDYHEAGFYYCQYNATADTIKNCPTKNSFYMLINKQGNTPCALQEITEYNNTPKKFFRTYYNIWNDWNRIYSTTDQPPPAATEKAGLVKPDNKTIVVTNDGTLSTKYMNKISITSGTDLNDYFNPGFYTCEFNSSNGELENRPTIYQFGMIVYPTFDRSSVCQLITENLTIPKTFFRIIVPNQNIFGDWHRIYTTVDKPPITNNLLATVAGTALDAVQGKILYDKIDALERQSVEVFSGIVEEWHGTNYMTLNLSDGARQIAVSKDLTILFTFGGGNQAIGAANGNIFSSCYVTSLGIWNIGIPIIEGKLAFLKLVDNTLYVWCNANPTYALRKIALVKNI